MSCSYSPCKLTWNMDSPAHATHSDKILGGAVNVLMTVHTVVPRGHIGRANIIPHVPEVAPNFGTSRAHQARPILGPHVHSQMAGKIHRLRTESYTEDLGSPEQFLIKHRGVNIARGRPRWQGDSHRTDAVRKRRPHSASDNVARAAADTKKGTVPPVRGPAKPTENAQPTTGGVPPDMGRAASR